MKNEILQLRSQGYSYNKIKEILGCSKSSISYHCGDGQKEKTRDRTKKNRKKIQYKLMRKLAFFFRDNIHGFKRTGEKTTTGMFKYKDGYEKIYKSPICYLTGRQIDFENSNSYHLDHIVAHSKGGSNDLDNMGLTCKEANMAKNDLSVDEFIQLCLDVCTHNGYKIEKIR